MEDATREEIAWAAGLFEGEGSWRTISKTSAEVVLGMTDRDVVERFAAIAGFGTIGHEPRRAPHKDIYIWRGSSATNVRALIERFWPWLGDRRREKATEILAHTENCPGSSRTRTCCSKGHPYNEIDTYTVPSTGYRQCRICGRERDREYAASNREKKRAYAAEWRAKNPERARALRRESYHRRKNYATP